MASAFAAKQAARSGLDYAKNAVTPSSGDSIKWEVYNFPPLLRLFHFTLSLEELEPEQRGVIMKVFI